MKSVQPALIQYLHTPDPLFAGKFTELRTTVEDWLAYVPQSFPHYTRHTVKHSDAIILQLSKLLFRDDDVNQPILPLSRVEAYILAASAMLHDSGMVVSDSEKAVILQSAEWQEWVREGSRKDRVRAIEKLRSAAQPPDSFVRNFLADVQLRFLIAEFVRIRHHTRGGDFLRQNQSFLGRFGLDDVSLTRTIGDVCVAHGLSRSELTDDARFPLERDVCGEKVNVRLMAMLLRLGDLLDMSSDRACPLLLSAASPIPSNSLAHWSQYQRIIHRNTSPGIIEIFAECETQDEHRILLDWCTWIVDEIESVPRLLPAARRHGDWSPPRATISAEGSIRIKPSPNASYIPSEWKIELDVEAVLDRLIKDAYREQLAFLREIIQNGIDATRCQLYLDLTAKGKTWPDWPSDLPRELRDEYPIRIKLTESLVYNELSTRQESVQHLEVEDFGTGMSIAIIEAYFLQVGRSFYRTPSFRRRFSFPPIGRHGVGFLSVFGVSDHVVVDTLWQTDGAALETNKLTFTGPRSYFLREKGSRNSRGTTIKLRLRTPLKPEIIEEFVRGLCRRVEFPIVMQLLGREIRLASEEEPVAPSSERDVSDFERELAVAMFPLQTGNIRGECYVFELRSAVKTLWNQWSWANYSYKESHPLARIPLLPESSVSENGLDYTDTRFSSGLRQGPVSIRIDYRGPQREISLDRGIHGFGNRISIDAIVNTFPELREPLERIVAEHLKRNPEANASDGWFYKQQLIEYFPIPEYWESCSGTLRLWAGGHAVYSSLADMLSRQRLLVAQSVLWHEPILTYNSGWLPQVVKAEEQASCYLDLPILTHNDLGTISVQFVDRIFNTFSLSDIKYLASGVLVSSWTRKDAMSSEICEQVRKHKVSFLPIEGFPHVGFILSHSLRTSYEGYIVFNSIHPFSRWFRSALEVCRRNGFGLSLNAVEPIFELVRKTFRYRAMHNVRELQEYLTRWAAIDNLPRELMPPRVSQGDMIASLPIGAPVAPAPYSYGVNDASP